MAIEVALGYVGLIALLAYPLGFVTLWIRLWKDYTNDSTVALYAATLIPPAVVVGKVINVLLLSSFTSVFTFYFSLLVYPIASTESWKRFLYRVAYRPEELSIEDRHVRIFRGSVLISISLSILMMASMPVSVGLLGFGLFSVDSSLDVLAYIGFLVFAIAGGVISAYLLKGWRPNENSLWGTFRGFAFRTILITLIGGTLAAVCLSMLQDVSLPTAKFDFAPKEDFNLLSHTAGYWYVFDSENNFLTVPDSRAGTVQISSASE